MATSAQQRTAETFDTYKDTYSQAVDDAVSFSGLPVEFFVRVKADHIVVAAARHFGNRKDLSVLDVGCGIGNYHQLLAPHFGHLSGVDVSAECVATARENNAHVEYKSYDGSTLPYADGSFDLAFTICVIHHVPPEHWAGFAGEMKRVLKPGGLALVFEHNPLNPLTMRAVNNCPFDEDATLLKSGTAKDLLRGAGFRDVRSQFILSVPPRGRLLKGVDRVLGALPLGAQYIVSAVV